MSEQPAGSPHYRVAGQSHAEGMAIGGQSTFSDWVHRVFSEIRPRRIIETGTYLGTGTTAIIASTLQQLGLTDAVFYSIEINPANFARAQANLAAMRLSARLLNGLSVPRALLPSLAQIEQAYVKNVEAPGIFVDHSEIDRAVLYHKETDFPHLPDDLLDLCLQQFQYRPDFLLLDSAGHMGNVEFNYVIPKLRGTCVLALDDVNHVKHFRSFQQIEQDSRFQVIVKSNEKFGFCFARFAP